MKKADEKLSMVDGSHTSKIQVDTFTATGRNTVIMLTRDQLHSGVLHIKDGAQVTQIRLGITAIECLAEVMKLCKEARSVEDK